MSTTPTRAHAILAPSAQDRWSSCAGSLAACKNVEEKRTSKAAALGTAKHAISEYLLNDPMPTRGCTSQVGSYVEADGFKFFIDDEFADQVDMYVNYVNSRPGRKLYEVQLNTSNIFGVPGQSGTSDCIHLDYELSEIEVIDAKFGYNPVSAKHKQLRTYGASALRVFDLEHEWKTVRCTIVQPQDKVESIKTHVYTREEIEAFIAEEYPKAQLAFKLYQAWDGEKLTGEFAGRNLLQFLTPSDSACAWCPIAGACQARANEIVNLFEDVSAVSPDVVLISDERLGLLMDQIEGIAQWAANIEEEAERRAKTGVKIPGRKLVYGRKGNRVYVEGKEAEITNAVAMVLGEEDMYQPRKLVSPTELEKRLKKAGAPGVYTTIATDYVTQAPAKLNLVPLSAKGEEVLISDVSFENVT